MANTGGNAHGTSSAKPRLQASFPSWHAPLLHGSPWAYICNSLPPSGVSPNACSPCAGITAGCGVISFTLGYARNSRSMTLKHGWTIPIRRIFEILALSVVYASTIFVTAFMLLSIASNMMELRTLKRLSDCTLRRDLGGRRALCHVRTGGTHECQDHRILVAVLRGFRCQHRRIDVR